MSEDLQRLFSGHESVRRWRAEKENADARLELALAAEARAFLLSQYEPVNKIGIDREALRVLLSFIGHHDTARLMRDVETYIGGGRHE